MSWFMTSYVTHCYAALRVVAGFLFLWHGVQKLFAFPSPMTGAPPFIIYGAGPIELVCGVLVMVGLFTRWAAFIASGEMAFAYWIGHGTKALLPLQNQGELAVLYCFIFLHISAQGAGIWSLDKSRNKGTA